MVWSHRTVLMYVGTTWFLLKLQIAVTEANDCPQGFFTCHDKECIHDIKHCDGVKDCKDNSDEIDCDMQHCKEPDWFLCDNGHCISRTLRCDGGNDCGNWNDEEDCDVTVSNPKNCSPDKWRCENNDCIPKNWVCDGQQDCVDGSDELRGCSEKTSCEDGFICDNQRCIPSAWVCDGAIDCEDDTDEKLCPSVSHVPPENCTLERSLFLCANKNECIEVKDLCDGVAHCLDGSDEGPGCNASRAACPTAGCSHMCVAAPQGPVCVCQVGYRTTDNKTCVGNLEQHEHQQQQQQKEQHAQEQQVVKVDEEAGGNEFGEGRERNELSAEPRVESATFMIRKIEVIMESILKVENETLEYLKEKKVRKDSENNEDMIFFRSLMSHVSKIPPEMKMPFRNRISQVVQEFAYATGRRQTIISKCADLIGHIFASNSTGR